MKSIMITAIMVSAFITACSKPCKCPKLETFEINTTVFEPIKMRYEVYEDDKNETE
jgi:hypothetical protein